MIQWGATATQVRDRWLRSVLCVCVCWIVAKKSLGEETGVLLAGLPVQKIQVPPEVTVAYCVHIRVRSQPRDSFEISKLRARRDDLTLIFRRRMQDASSVSRRLWERVLDPPACTVPTYHSQTFLSG